MAGGGLLQLGAVERLVAADAVGARRRPIAQPYGPLRRTPDQRGVEVLALPAGFSYVTFSHTGSTMSDGNPTPLALDGMGVFGGGRHHGHGPQGHGHHKGHERHNGHKDRLVRLVRNSEDRNPVGTAGGLLGDRSKAYDPTGFGGTATVVYDERRRELVEDFVSLDRRSSTAPRRQVLSAPVLADRRGERRRPEAPDPTQRFAKPHGYLFATPVDRGPGELEVGEPLVDAGRFSHEAAAVDQRTGVVYETEDPGSGVAPASTAIRRTTRTT